MSWLSDKTLARLRSVVDETDLSGTKYQMIEKLAQGGMGTVYTAHDQELNRNVALKVMNVIDASGDLAARMRREAQIVARLEHPGIVPVHDVGTLSDERVFYTMKLVQGSRLDEYRQKNSGRADLMRLFERICEAVAFAHAHGVIHRDLKPENIMVGSFGEVLVMDWGVAKVLDEARYASINFENNDQALIKSVPSTKHGTVVGTPGYMSPEQQRGETEFINERSDVYSLGAILYFLLTGVHPSESEPLRPPRSVDASIPKTIESVCLKAMSSESTDRYATASELADDVARFADHLPVSAYRENILERFGRWLNKNRFIVYLVLAYLLLRFIVLILLRR